MQKLLLKIKNLPNTKKIEYITVTLCLITIVAFVLFEPKETGKSTAQFNWDILKLFDTVVDTTELDKNISQAESMNEELSQYYDEYKTGDTVQVQYDTGAVLNVSISQGYIGIVKKDGQSSICICQSQQQENYSESTTGTLMIKAMFNENVVKDENNFKNAMYDASTNNNYFMRIPETTIIDDTGKEITYFVQTEKSDATDETYNAKTITAYYINDDGIIVYAVGSLPNATDKSVNNFVKDVFSMITI